MNNCKIIVMPQTFDLLDEISQQYLLTNFEVREIPEVTQYLISK